jgi:hypothetical protein
MVCVLELKSEVGMWKSVLNSVINGMKIVLIKYHIMKVKNE